MREPLSGHEAVLPVSETVRHWHASPRAAVGFLLRAMTMDLSPLGARRNLQGDSDERFTQKLAVGHAPGLNS